MFPNAKLGLADPTCVIAPARMPAPLHSSLDYQVSKGGQLFAKEGFPKRVSITEIFQWSSLTLFQKPALRPLL